MALTALAGSTRLRLPLQAPDLQLGMGRAGPVLTCTFVHRTLTWSRKQQMIQTESSVVPSRAQPPPESEKEASLWPACWGGGFRMPLPLAAP